MRKRVSKMLIIENKLNSELYGVLKMVAQTTGDLYVICDILRPGTQFGCKSSRKIMIGQHQERKQLKLIMKVTKVYFQRSTEVVVINGLITMSSNPDVPLHSSHQFCLPTGMEFTVARNWSAEEFEMMSQKADYQSQALVVLSQGVARIALIGEAVEHIDRIEHSIPGKDRFNQDKIDRSTTRFVDDVIKAINNKIQILQLVVCGQQQFVEMLEARKSEFAKFDTTFVPTKAFTLRAVIQELISSQYIKQQMWQNVSDILEEIRTSLSTTQLALYSSDVLLAIKQQPYAISKIVVLQSVLNDDNAVLRTIASVPDLVIKVPDYSEPAEILRSFGGMACTLKYQIWLEKLKEEGKVFTNFDVFEDSLESEAV